MKIRSNSPTKRFLWTRYLISANREDLVKADELMTKYRNSGGQMFTETARRIKAAMEGEQR